MNKEHCNGCYKDFYNHGGFNGNTNSCWSFKNATLSKGRKQHKDTLPKNYKGEYKPIPDCYVYQFGFIERLENEL